MAMKLSAELFNEIISSLRSDGTSSHGHEKRTQGRVGLRCALEVVPCAFSPKAPKAITICVHDISQNGIGLMSPIRFEKEMEFVARLTRDGHSPIPVLYKVRYCRRLAADLFNVGAMFQRVLPDASGEVIALGKKGKGRRKNGASETSSAAA